MKPRAGKSGENLGEFEVLVLAALVRLGPEAYGVTIRREIETRACRDVSIGALYSTLSRLEAKGLVRSRMGDPTPERGGRAKRHYRIEPRGRALLEQSLTAFHRMSQGIIFRPMSTKRKAAP